MVKEAVQERARAMLYGHVSGSGLSKLCFKPFGVGKILSKPIVKANSQLNKQKYRTGTGLISSGSDFGS